MERAYCCNLLVTYCVTTALAESDECAIYPNDAWPSTGVVSVFLIPILKSTGATENRETYAKAHDISMQNLSRTRYLACCKPNIRPE